MNLKPAMPANLDRNKRSANDALKWMHYATLRAPLSL